MIQIWKIRVVPEEFISEILERYRPEEWSIYPFHYSDGDNWSARDTERCIAVLRDEIKILKKVAVSVD